MTDPTRPLPPLPDPFMELHREIAPHVYAAWADQMRSYATAATASDAALLREMAEALKQKTEDAEQGAFEAWAEIERPSGDAESVQRQWEQSPNYGEFNARWSLQLAALRAYKEKHQ